MSSSSSKVKGAASSSQQHFQKQSSIQPPPRALSNQPAFKPAYVPAKPTWSQVLPPSYLQDDSIELIIVGATTSGMTTNDGSAAKYKRGGGPQVDDFYEKLYSTKTPIEEKMEVQKIEAEGANAGDDNANDQLLLDGTNKKQRNDKKSDPKFLIYAFAGCILFASGGIIRKYQGQNVFLANAMITISFLFTGLFYFLFSIIKTKFGKLEDNLDAKQVQNVRTYLFPWQKWEETNIDPVVITKKKTLALVMIGGALEYIGAQASTIAFNGALAAGMNGGIVASLISLNTGFVIIMAYFMFKESFGKIQYISVVLLVTSVVLVTLFPPENITSRNDMIIPGASGADGHITIANNLTEDELFFNKVLLIGGGLVASVSLGSQLLVFKVISFETKDMFGVGFGFLFACGILGLISLVIQSVRDFESVLELPLVEYVGPLAIGLFTALAIVFANIGAGIGIAGISNSIIQSSIVIVATFNYFVFNQPLSIYQAIGIVMTLIGLFLLALEEKITGKTRYNKNGVKTIEHAGEVPML